MPTVTPIGASLGARIEGIDLSKLLAAPDRAHASDYRPDEPRLMRRCQVMADWVFTPEAKAASLM